MFQATPFSGTCASKNSTMQIPQTEDYDHIPTGVYTRGVGGFCVFEPNISRYNLKS